MNSSYKNTINYSDIFKTICFLKNPKNIVEIGILDGFSLKAFADSSPNAIINAYDIFEDFNGNGSKRDIINNFTCYPNVSIHYGDYYKLQFENKSIDILHIDIANNGDTYKYMFENYISKMKSGGIIILEGGSIERDNIEWMKKYNKQPIFPIIEKYKTKYEINIIETFPSLTIIKIP